MHADVKNVVRTSKTTSKAISKMKDIVFFDLETTGLNTVTDRIVELYAKRISPDGSERELHQFFNPGMPMPAEAEAVHHISDTMLADKPAFADKAKEVFDFFSDCYICGHNVLGYDCVMLSEELSRSGFIWPADKKLILDTYKVEKKLRSHSLIATYKRYFGVDYSETIGQAHGAKADVLATIEVFKKQLEECQIDLVTDEAAEQYRQVGKPDDNVVDIAGNLVLINGEICFNFGKNKGQPVKLCRDYAMWMLGQSFASSTKAIIKQIIF